MNHPRSLSIVAALLVVSSSVSAQLPAPKKMDNKTEVVLRIPWLMVKQTPPSETYTVAETSDGLTVNGMPLNGALGLNDTLVFKKRRAGNWTGGTHFLTLEARGKTVHLHIPAKDEATAQRILNQVVGLASSRRAIRDSLSGVTANGWFVGELREWLPIEIRKEYVQKMHDGAAPVISFRTSSSADGGVVQMSLGSTDYIYNDLQVGTTERAARAIEKYVMQGFRAAGRIAAALPETVAHLTAEIAVGHRSFDTPTAPLSIDRLQVEVKRTKLLEFVDAKITAQELIESGRVLLDGALVKPRLDP